MGQESYFPGHRSDQPKEESKKVKDAYIWYDYFGIPQLTARSADQAVGATLQAAANRMRRRLVVVEVTSGT